MAPEPAREVLLVHNEHSPVARDAVTRTAAVLRATGYRPVPLGAHSAAALSETLTHTVHARALHLAAVLAVGGDGMAHLALQMLHRVSDQGLELPFGLVPAGSGNDLARFCGLPTRDVEAAAARAVRGLESPARHMDLLEVRCADGSQHVCATTVCLGLDADVNARANRWHRITSSAKYGVALAVESLRLPARHYSLSWRDPHGAVRVLEHAATFVTITNTSSYGGGLRIVPRADPRDGQAELFCVRAISPWRFAWLLPRLFVGRHERLPEVAIEPAVAVTAAELTGPGAPPPRVAHGDGEALGPLPVTVRVLPAAVRTLF